MTQSALIDISPAQDGGVLKETRREGPDPDDKPWKGDRVQVKAACQTSFYYIIIKFQWHHAMLRNIMKINVLSILGALHRYT